MLECPNQNIMVIEIILFYKFNVNIWLQQQQIIIKKIVLLGSFYSMLGKI